MKWIFELNFLKFLKTGHSGCTIRHITNINNYKPAWNNNSTDDETHSSFHERQILFVFSYMWMLACKPSICVLLSEKPQRLCIK